MSQKEKRNIEGNLSDVIGTLSRDLKVFYNVHPKSFYMILLDQFLSFLHDYFKGKYSLESEEAIWLVEWIEVRNP